MILEDGASTPPYQIIFAKPANGLIIFLTTVAGVLRADVVCGVASASVFGRSICGFAIVDAASALVLLFSLLRFGVSLIFGCVWH